jgi:methanogenic corrinoid protein MtbC1
VTLDAAALSERERDAYMAHLAARDRSAAIAHVMRRVDEGLSAEDVVARILGPAQREVGRLWEIGEWSIAQEHIATGITDDVLHAVSLRQPDAVASRGHVVVACMEGEYHAMPARMLAEVLRGARFVVTFVGASLPADSLRSILPEAPAMALALSCSLSPHLLLAATGIDIAHAQGVPVMCGGAAFGTDPRRARALGADAWAADAMGAIETLERWASEPPQQLNVVREVPGEEIDIATMRRGLVEEAVALGAPQLSGAGETADRTTARLRLDVGDVIDHLAVAVRLRDVTVLDDYMSWSERVGPGLSGSALSLVAQALPPRLTMARRMLDDVGEGRTTPTAA